MHLLTGQFGGRIRSVHQEPNNNWLAAVMGVVGSLEDVLPMT